MMRALSARGDALRDYAERYGITAQLIMPDNRKRLTPYTRRVLG